MMYDGWRWGRQVMAEAHMAFDRRAKKEIWNVKITAISHHGLTFMNILLVPFRFNKHQIIKNSIPDSGVTFYLIPVLHLLH
jgi:hypothetical protein